MRSIVQKNTFHIVRILTYMESTKISWEIPEMEGLGKDMAAGSYSILTILLSHHIPSEVLNSKYNDIRMPFLNRNIHLGARAKGNKVHQMFLIRYIPKHLNFK